MNTELSTSGKQHRLGEWYATAICGNDITSSCLYVSALALLWAGPLAPISLLLVAGALWLFRGIYTEVVEALPLNGGAYNALLNTTSKFRASIAACLTILSYLATAVISATEAIHYIDHICLNFFDYKEALWRHSAIVGGTILLLFGFALLVARGIGESAVVALAIFIFHMVSLFLLLILGGLAVWNIGLGTLYTNLQTPPPYPSNAPLFFGFAVAMLGISGFESSSNFVEEQQPGVFPKTLRNMWIAVSFFNPTICILALALIPLSAVDGHQNALLAYMGKEAAGSWFGILISIDAAIVLSGAVLTSFVGVTGLVHRMALDRCLPQLLLKKGKKKTFYRIIILFFVVSATLLISVNGEVSLLAGVYTISFLSVMALFVLGNIFLKIRRARLPRTKRVNWITLFIALVATAMGIIGNVILKTEYITLFLVYFIPTLLIVAVMLWRIRVLKIGIYVVQSLSNYVDNLNQSLTSFMSRKIDQINSQEFVFFTRGDNIANLNEVMLYIRTNELTRRVKVVTIVPEEQDLPSGLRDDLDFLDKAYPEMKIDCVIRRGEFTPELLEELSLEWDVPLNFMFIGSPGDKFPHRISDLGGVRLII